MREPEYLYRVTFLNQGQVYEVYVKNIYQSDIYGFVEIEQFVFGGKSQVVVDPGEEKLRGEFQDVVCSFVPMHSIIRIDQVEKGGVAKISEPKGPVGGVSNVSPFPVQFPSSPDRNRPPKN
jgi:hypothetical protein